MRTAIVFLSLILPSVRTCLYDSSCPALHRCNIEGECEVKPTLDRNCSDISECLLIDYWADCVDNRCRCSHGTFNQGEECVNLTPNFGRNTTAAALFYSILGLAILLFISLATSYFAGGRNVPFPCVEIKSGLTDSEHVNHAFDAEEDLLSQS